MANKEEKAILRRILGSYLSSIVSITLVLLLVGVASALLVNAARITDYLKENVKVSVLLKQNVKESRAMAFEESLQAKRYVKASRYISVEEGVAEMKDILGEDFMNVFETAPIPISIDLTLFPAYIHPDSLDIVKKDLMRSDLVSEVSCPRGIVESLTENIGKISAVLAVLIAMLLFISFILISNTVRLNVYSHRFSIHTQKLVGATAGFISRPFLVEAFLEGLLCSMLSIGALTGIMYFLRSEIVQLFKVFPAELFVEVACIVVASGVVICLVSTAAVLSRLLRLKKEELYF